MMKTSFSTLACPHWGLPQVLEAAVTYGFDGVELRALLGELDLWKLPEFRSHSLGATRTKIEDHGVLIPCVGTSARFHSPEVAERQSNFDHALRMAELAAGLGTPSIRVFSDRIQPGCTRKQTATWVADSLSQLSERLKPEGIQVWLETHGDFATAADVCEILTQINAGPIGVIWDPANAFAQNGEAPLLLASLATRIRHVHIKDLRPNAQGSPQYVPTGEGDFPFAKMFESLGRIDYRGFISFEWEKLWHPELDPPEVALPHFIEWWKSMEASLCLTP